jgi:hypothetical protein
VSDFYRSDGTVVRLFKLDRTIAHILACVRLERASFIREGRVDLPSISFHAFRKSSGSENATNPYLALRHNPSAFSYDTIQRRRVTFWLSLSRMTRAFWNEGYLLKAFARTSSDTSLLKSPTNKRNQAETPSAARIRENKGRTYMGSIRGEFGPPTPCHLPSVGQSSSSLLWPACHQLRHVYRSWRLAHRRSVAQGCQRHIRRHLLELEHYGRRKTPRWDT